MVLSRTLPIVTVVFSFAGLALLLFTLIGSIKNDVVLRDIYFLKLNTTNLSTDVIPKLESLSSNDKTKLAEFETITVGLWSYCWGNATGTLGCSDTSARFHFSLSDIFYKALGYFVTVDSPGNLSDNNTKILNMNRSMIALYIVAISFSFITFALAIVSVMKFKLIRTITALTAFFAFAGSLISSAVATGLYLYVKEQFQDNNSSISASLGRVAQGLSWGSALAGLVAFITSVVSICTTRRQKNTEVAYEKQPFLESDGMEGGVYPPPVAGSHPPDMFSYHSGHASNEPQFIQPTYYDHSTPRP